MTIKTFQMARIHNDHCNVSNNFELFYIEMTETLQMVPSLREIPTLLKHYT